MPITLKPQREQVIVVTGATSGNGLAIVAVARNEAALETIRSRLVDDGARISVTVADVSDMAAVECVVDIAEQAHGGFDSWINNAGTGTYGTLEQGPLEDHRCVFDVNYFRVLHGSLVAARHLRRRGSGAIINVGSILSNRAIVQRGRYCATKHAVQALTDTLRMELEREGAGTSVALVKPAETDTPFAVHARNFLSEPPRGLVASLLSRAALRLADFIMERAGTAVQQMPSGPPLRRGGQDVHARGSSVIVQIQKAPSCLFRIAAIDLGAAIFAIDRAMGSTRS